MRTGPHISPTTCFPHEGLENDWGDDAIHIKTGTTNVHIGPGNKIKTDTFGEYTACATSTPTAMMICSSPTGADVVVFELRRISLDISQPQARAKKGPQVRLF